MNSIDEQPVEPLLNDPPKQSQATPPSSLAGAPEQAPPTTSEPPAYGPNIKNKSKNRRMVILIIITVVTLAIGAILVWLFIFGKNASDQTANNSAKTGGSTASITADLHSIALPERGAAKIPAAFLKHNATLSGVSLGYIKANKKVTTWPFEGTAKAGGVENEANTTVDSYYPSLLFVKSVNGKDQIVGYSIGPNTETQYSDEAVGARHAVFSSASQKISYEGFIKLADDGSSGANGNGCDLVVKDIVSGQVKRVQRTGKVCYNPIAWSPDGTKLLYEGINNELNAPDWGLAKLYIYTEQNPQTAVPMANEINSYDGYSWWGDNTNFYARFAYHEKGNVSNRNWLSYNTTTWAVSATNIPGDDDSVSAQTVGDKNYYIDSDLSDRSIRYITAGPNSISVVPNTEDSGSFLLRLDKYGILSQIVFMTSSVSPTGGGLQSFQANTANIDGSQKAQLFNFDSYTAWLLSWGADYNEFVYLFYNNGKLDAHVYNLETKTDYILYTGLPLIQT
jgi:hypothetical protein